MPAQISINGASQGSGHSISLSGTTLIVDGKEFDTGTDRQITIQISGDVGDLIVGACDQVNIDGSVGTVSVQEGSVSCAEVAGSVSTMSGDVTCGDVGGSVSSMGGTIRHH